MKKEQKTRTQPQCEDVVCPVCATDTKITNVMHPDSRCNTIQCEICASEYYFRGDLTTYGHDPKCEFEEATIILEGEDPPTPSTASSDVSDSEEDEDTYSEP